MKRFLALALVFCSALSLAVSCKKPTVEPALDITTPAIMVAEGENTSTFTFKANNDWTVTSSDAWCKVSPTSGAASENAAMVTLTLEPNTTGAARTATVTVKAGGLEKQITVTQAPEAVKQEDIAVNFIWNYQDDTQITNRYLKVKYQAPFRDGGAHAFYANVKADFMRVDGVIPNFVFALEDDSQDCIQFDSEVYYKDNNDTYDVCFYIVKNPGTEPRTGRVRIATADGQHVSDIITIDQTGMPEHAVDIGFARLWREYNLGASAPEEFGDYYAWGELAPKTTYTWDNYNCVGGDKYSKIDRSNGGYSWSPTLWNEHDAVSQSMNPEFVQYGPYWEMPSKSDFEQLLATREQTDTYKWEWKTINGHSGWQITYLVNGNSIFLPAGGYKMDDALQHPELGMYWSTEALFENEWTPSVSATDKSYYLRFEPGPDGEVALYSDGARAAGKLLRPVTY
ncbi:MAG: BACON domain-containing protein [Bacteroidales bacterium]|nr:BACON domain-containing protein [Bacteroidales bacterium]